MKKKRSGKSRPRLSPEELKKRAEAVREWARH